MYIVGFLIDYHVSYADIGRRRDVPGKHGLTQTPGSKPTRKTPTCGVSLSFMQVVMLILDAFPLKIGQTASSRVITHSVVCSTD